MVGAKTGTHDVASKSDDDPDIEIDKLCVGGYQYTEGLEVAEDTNAVETNADVVSC